MTPAQWANISVLVAHDKGNTGRIKMTNADIAMRRVTGQRKNPPSERTVRKQTALLVAEGIHLAREGWTWIILGYAEHDIRHCPNGDCIIDLTEIRKAERARAV